MSTKVCRRCGIDRAADRFRARSGRAEEGVCKDCRNERRRKDTPLAQQGQLRAQGLKHCSRCDSILPLEAFQKSWKVKQGYWSYQNTCKPCRSEFRRNDPKTKEQNRQAKREKYATEDGRARLLELQFKTRTGITIEQRDALLKAQGGVCAVCGTDTPDWNRGWHLDHDHACCPGKKACGNCARGILCGSCNIGLGNFGDDPDRLIAAAMYLMSSRDLLAADLMATW